MKQLFQRWVLVILWLLVIFAGSSVGNLPHADSKAIDVIIHRTGHLIEYAILGALLVRAWRQHRSIVWRDVIIVIIACGLYGFSDEWHQSFTVGRSSELSAVLFDMAGGLIGAVIYRWWRR
jgi:VanZ family protein